MRDSDRAITLKAALAAASTEYQKALAAVRMAAHAGAGGRSAPPEIESRELDLAYGRYIEALADYIDHFRAIEQDA